LNLLFRYVVKQVAVFTLALTVGFVGLALLTRSLSIVELMVNNGLPISVFFYMIMLLIPSLVQVILPIALTIACMFVFNKMHSDNEMMIFNSSGVNPLKIAAAPLFLSILFGGFLFVNAGYLMPKSALAVSDARGKIATRFAASMLQSKKFIDVGKQRTLYFDSVKNGELQDLVIRDETNPKLPSTTFAKTGKFLDVNEGSYVVLNQVEQLGYDAGNQTPFRVKSEQQIIEIASNKSGTTQRNKRVKELNLVELQQGIKTTAAGWEKNRMVRYFHAAISAPFLSFALVILVVNMLLNVSRNRQGLGKRMSIVIGLVVLFLLLDVVAKSEIKGDEALWPLVYINALMAGLTGLVLPRILKWFA